MGDDANPSAFRGILTLAMLGIAAVPLAKLGAAPATVAPVSADSPRADSTHSVASSEVDEYCGERFASPFQRRSGLLAKPVPPSSDSFVKFSSKKSRETWNVSLAGDGSDSTSWESRVLASRKALCDADPSTTFESLVALVPDPTESGLTYTFHSHLHGLQTGMEDPVADSTALVRDESWLAWDDRRVPADSRRNSEDCRYSTPSVLMFRRAKAPEGAGATGSELSMVFAVGDSPVTGPFRAALGHALVAAEVFSGSCQPGRPTPSLRVLGPAFSGGAPTLRAALLEHRHRFADIRVVSGTASATDVPKFFSTLTQAPLTVSFERTTAAEPDLKCALHDYVQQALSPFTSDEPRTRVALLHEGGTAFGLDRGTNECAFTPLLDIQFPVGIAAIREEYEQLNRRAGDGATASIARRTSLELTMQDEQRALNFEADPSNRTNDARDLSLARALASIASMQVQYAAIQATDVADAMFLSRRIRDIAPNVRIVFLEANSILTHPSYRGDLLGSLVVSPYPMLGASPFQMDALPNTEQLLMHGVFESDSALGVHNAVAWLRGKATAGLRDYTPLGAQHPLPIWVSAIGRGGFVPVHIHMRADKSAAGDAQADANASPHALGYASGIEAPRLWQLMFLSLLCLVLIDWIRQAREQMRFEIDKGCHAVEVPLTVPTSSRVYQEHSDHGWDLAAIRVKAVGQQAMRSAIVACLMLYMVGSSWIGYGLFTGDWWTLKLYLSTGLLLLVFALAALRVRQFMQLRKEFRTHAIKAGNAEDRAGAEDFRDRVLAGLKHGGWLGVLCFTVVVVVAALHLFHHVGATAAIFSSVARAASSERFDLVAQHGLLFVLRQMDLASGISPFAPLAFSALCAYFFALGRTSRLLTAYALASVAPPDGVSDGVSTPLAALLYPANPLGPGTLHWTDRRTGLLADEVHLVKAVAHPSTENRRRLFAVLVAALPILFAFFLKRPSAIGSWRETALLFIVLTVCAALTLLVLLYLTEYWQALERVLKRIMEHPIGFSLSRTHPFARDALPDMVARDPDETLRLAACAQIGSTLLRTIPASQPMWRRRLDVEPGEIEEWRARALRRPSHAWGGWWGIGDLLRRDRASLTRSPARPLPGSEEAGFRTLGSLLPGRPSPGSIRRARASSAPPGEHNPETVANLGLCVMGLACDGMRLLEEAWGNDPNQVHARPRNDTTPLAKHGAWAATHMLYEKHELTWLRDLESYVATVIALVIGRYVRQYKHFVYASTGCGVLLLCAVSSYSFEPRRVLMTCIWLLMAAIVSLTTFVYIGLDRNTLLSHISGSSPNRVTLSSAVMWRGLLWVVLPLLSVFAAQYPDLVNAVYGVFEPMVRALH